MEYNHVNCLVTKVIVKQYIYFCCKQKFFCNRYLWVVPVFKHLDISLYDNNDKAFFLDIGDWTQAWHLSHTPQSFCFVEFFGFGFFNIRSRALAQPASDYYAPTSASQAAGITETHNHIQTRCFDFGEQTVLLMGSDISKTSLISVCHVNYELANFLYWK